MVIHHGSVCDHSLVSYALEQSEMLRSPDYSCKCCAQFQLLPTVLVVGVRCSECFRLKNLEEKWICRLGTLHEMRSKHEQESNLRNILAVPHFRKKQKPKKKALLK